MWRSGDGVETKFRGKKIGVEYFGEFIRNENI